MRNISSHILITQMSFIFSRLLGGSAARTVETRAVATTAGNSGLLTKVGLGLAGVSLASPLLSSLSSIPVVGQAFQPASQLANSGLGLAQSGLTGATGAVSSVGSILSNPVLLLAGGGLVLVFLMKK